MLCDDRLRTEAFIQLNENRAASEVTRDPSNATFSNPLNVKGLGFFLTRRLPGGFPHQEPAKTNA